LSFKFARINSKLSMTDAITPDTAEELAEALRDAASADRPVVPWGAGTLQRIGAAPPAHALALHTTALNGVLDYHPPDLTITIQAGIALDTLQAALGRHGQWLPWLPPAPGAATVGGLLAAGVGGPLRLGYSTPRDWALGMRVALADGRLVKSGGKVVKNVAGYETHKLHIGALGTLGVIVEATFKVFPLPERVGGLLIGCDTRGQALALEARLRARPLAPAGIAILAGGAVADLSEYLTGARPHMLLAARFDGVQAAVERQLHAAAAYAADIGARAVRLGDEQAQDAWESLAFAPGPSPVRGGGEHQELLIRAGARPSALVDVLEALERYAPGGAARIVGYGGMGLAYTRWPLEGAAIGTIAALRDALAAVGGYAVVEDAPAGLLSSVDIWGAPPATLPLMRSLKARWDPRGILNPSRYVGGI
jgi:glycolate oxidase FAD binding subunit